MKKEFTFSVQHYVPIRFVWAFAFSLVLLYAIVELSIVLIIISAVAILVCLTTVYKVDVNIEEKWFKEYTWFMGIKSGDAEKYQSIDYAFIVRNKVSQTTNSRIQSTSVTKDEYRGYIKFDGEEKIHIVTNGSHDKIVSDMKAIAGDLQVSLIDNSSGQPIQLQ